MVKIAFIFLLLLLFSRNAYSQTLSNVRALQEGQTVVIQYELTTAEPCKIYMYVSIDGGSTWKGPLKHVSGDIGDYVSSGTKTIYWYPLNEYQSNKRLKTS
jgi:hypothetical protein